MANFTLVNSTANDIWINDILIPAGGSKSVDGLTAAMFAQETLGNIAITPDIPTNADAIFVINSTGGTGSTTYTLAAVAANSDSNNNFTTLANVINNLSTRIAYLERRLASYSTGG